MAGQIHPGLDVESNADEIQQQRKSLLQMLFVEGNHVCLGCEKSGACQLQAVAYYVGMLSPYYTHFFPRRKVDASHPDCVIDFNCCILCELCVRASRDVDGKNGFAIAGRGIKAHLTVNSPFGKLGDSEFAATDKAAAVCPVGAILPKQIGYKVPIGERLYDKQAIDVMGGKCIHGTGAIPGGVNKAPSVAERDELLDGQELTEPLLNQIEVVIRAYDPCLSCAMRDGQNAAAD